MKPGYKTTEFYVTLLAVLASAAAPIFGPAIDAEAGRTIGKLGPSLAPLAAAVYVAGRSWVKSRVAERAQRPADPGR